MGIKYIYEYNIININIFILSTLIYGNRIQENKTSLINYKKFIMPKEPNRKNLFMYALTKSYKYAPYGRGAGQK